MAFSAAIFFCGIFYATTLVGADPQNKTILIVLTNVDKLAGTDHGTGWFLPELSHPFKILYDLGYDFESVSPLGGPAPIDPGSFQRFKDDPVSKWFLANPLAQDLIQNTLEPSQVNPADYAAVFYPGGHGPMYDLATDEDVAAITAQVFENGGVVAAVCHGPAGLIPVKLSNGDPIVKGRMVTSFSDAEETAVGLKDVVPFLLESKLREQGGDFSSAGLGQSHVVVDGNLVTGQNPASAVPLVNAMLTLL